jgi:hypothetical protein
MTGLLSYASQSTGKVLIKNLKHHQGGNHGNLAIAPQKQSTPMWLEKGGTMGMATNTKQALSTQSPCCQLVINVAHRRKLSLARV